MRTWRRTMYFVGSRIERDGVEKYRALRERMPRDAGVEELAAVYEAVLAAFGRGRRGEGAARVSRGA